MRGVLAAVPDPPDDLADDQQGVPSLWETFTEEAVGPLRLTLPVGRGEVYEWTLRAPARDGVADLDVLTHPRHQVAALIGDEQVADDVLDALEHLDWHHTLDVLDDIRGHFELPHLPAGLWTHLVEQIDCYGRAIEQDLALGGPGYTGGHDLLDWFRGRRPWTQLARLIVGLPEGSRTWAAILDDEDLAADRLADGEEPPAGRSTPPLLGETPERTLQRAMLSTLRQIEHAVYAAQAGKKAGPRPRALPGPETAMDRLREATADQELEELFDTVSPGWRDPPTGFAQRDSGLLVPD